MLAWSKRLIVPLLLILVAIQIFQAARTNPPIDPKLEMHANLAVDPAVASVFHRSCDDCHSHRTEWPWYSHVAPVSWLVVSDVNRGRRAMNFSEWATYRPEEQQKQLSEICKVVSEGEMPGLSYTVLHRSAKLSPADVATLCRWTQTPLQGVSASAGEE
jgi:hypothetical protein